MLLLPMPLAQVLHSHQLPPQEANNQHNDAICGCSVRSIHPGCHHTMTSASPTSPYLALISLDIGLASELKNTLGSSNRIGLQTISATIEAAVNRPELDQASVIVVDLDARDRESLLALQRLMTRIGARTPVIALTDSFDAEVARWLIQIRVADFLHKPVPASEVLGACVKALRAVQDTPQEDATIYAFLPAAGGVGVTTLAIETAMILHRGGRREGRGTCLVDLDFQSGACADYLDIEPRFDLNELGANGERLDQQMIEVMLSKHSSGLSVLSAIGRPAETAKIDANVVARLLDLVSSRFDNIVIDMPRNWFPWTDDVAVGANHFYLVTDMTVPGLRLARRMASAFDQRFGQDVKAKVIVNRFEQQSMFGTGLRRADVERALDSVLAGVVTNNYRLVREAIDRGVTLEEVKQGNSVTTDLKKIIFA
jgi:pilus assembly protein CpaE